MSKDERGTLNVGRMEEPRTGEREYVENYSNIDTEVMSDEREST